MKKLLLYIPHVLAVFITIIFVDSLRYKFTNHPKTERIFNTLNEWAGTLGFEGLFSHVGLFSQYVIGSAELVASAFLVLGILASLRFLQAWGALIAFCVMTGALFFHLFTPLGVDPNHDGGGLFMVAILVWLSSIALIIIHRQVWLSLVGKNTSTLS